MFISDTLSGRHAKVRTYAYEAKLSDLIAKVQQSKLNFIIMSQNFKQINNFKM